ncbi:MAG: phenylalanine--tRNA ligase subunit alpha [Nitrospirae bacterium RBG_16_64_22]|nr:MAG: phenylalanine--tRNA ligase subunit alpha [Nitrospirae bacterium RBG_16_64_22]
MSESLVDQSRALAAEASDAVGKADSLAAIESLRVLYLGKKGRLAEMFRRLAELTGSEKSLAGSAVNTAKREIEEAIRSREEVLEAQARDARLSSETVDVSLPGRQPLRGRLHPITQVMDEIVGVFSALGFAVAEGPEVETDRYNFEALNFPLDHPARDMQDTFFLPGGLLLRTHTSPVQVRVMERLKPPIRIVAPGKVYRRDADVTHAPMFHQVEGFLVDREVSFADLKGVLSLFARTVFSPDVRVRFRPSFFPFVEPGAEMDIGCVLCGGKGCRVCGGSGWLEILGAGLIHPNVFRAVGYDPEETSGFAFGMGVERIAMLRYGIDDIRLFAENDLRFLHQF